MRYMLLIHWDEKAGLAAGDAKENAEVAEHGKFIQALMAENRLVEGMRLRPTADATRVQVRDGRRRTTDGPFTEAKEAIGGYYVIECATKEEAIEWAARCPSSRSGTVEVRPEWPTP